ncbi:TolC family outer membrane protein [Ectothiorhodospira magna]|uniref:TolC family outer membrane protein n=1 Tax=Ectothiorhodospira magna TaxID=867345 RepID=UPI000B7FDC9D|nr:TolC family outer membrane protein [Ectothiorhodospira magna]
MLFLLAFSASVLAEETVTPAVPDPAPVTDRPGPTTLDADTRRYLGLMPRAFDEGQITESLPAGPGLYEIYQLALDHDDAWAAARARLEGAREAYPIARAQLLPRVTLSGSTGETRRESETAMGTDDRTYTQDTVRLQARQPLFNLDSFNRTRMALREVDVSEYELEMARQELIQRVVEAYTGLLLAQERLNLVRLQAQAVEAQKHQAERMRVGGIATRTDVQEAQARLDLIRAQEIQAVNQRDIRRRELRLITYTLIEAVQPLREDMPFTPPEPADMDIWIAQAGEQSLDVLAQTQMLEREQFNVRRARSQHYPTLDLVAGYERFSNSDLGYSRDEYGRIMVELNLPLYQGGRVTAETRQARAGVDEARQRLERSRRESELAAGSAWLDLVNSLARIEALEQARQSSETALMAAEVSLTVAYRTFVDVLNAQQQLYEARFELLSARIDYVRAFVALHAATGALDDGIIERLDGWLKRS